MPPAPLAHYRQKIKENALALKADFAQHANTGKLFKQHCKFMDAMLTELWAQSNLSESACLIAVGGYGRGELYPYSDIDLLILMPEGSNQDTPLAQAITVLVGFLWDIGLNVGHSVRTLDECITEAKNDITVQTNLIESRLLTGCLTLYQHFLSGVQGGMDIVAFFTAKIKEQTNRHTKFNDTAYNLEPNIKESPGGLRDLHSIIWLWRSINIHKGLQAITGTSAWAAMVKQNIISPQEARQIRKHEKNLQALRIHLHFLSHRREDRLLFDFQNELATTLGYVTTPRKRASEQLMQNYYRSVRFVRLMNEILLQTMQQAISTAPIEIKPINARFEAHDGFLAVKTAGLLQQQPSAIFEAFLLLQQHPTLTGMSATLLRNLQRVKRLVNRDFRQNPHHKKRFIEILSQPWGVNHALRAMNRYGILGSYIPAFDKIIGQMQHDLFHVYTVDEHILNVLANLRRFAKPELKHEFPLCSQLFAAFDKPKLLYLAALFHDIAKGRGGDHSTLGAVDAKKFCKQHGLEKEDTALVVWLVDSHLKMSATAQKSDLSDPAVIETFAQFVGNVRRLTALYLLTVADIRGTSPAVWNAWKARLLENLFTATKNVLAISPMLLTPYTQQAIKSRKSEAAGKLVAFGLKAESYENLWNTFGEGYFSRYESSEIAWHSRLLTPHLNTNQAIVRARLSPSGEGIQVMIYTKNQNDLFAKICNFFDRMAYSIVEAKIYTTHHGYALDNFTVLDQSGKSVSYSGLLNFIESQLTQKLDPQQPLEAPLQGRISRQVKHMPLQTQVRILEDTQHHTYQLEVIANDRPGLLATIAQAFLKHHFALHNAKINTLGNRVEDTFLISDKRPQTTTSHALAALSATLTNEV